MANAPEVFIMDDDPDYVELLARCFDIPASNLDIASTVPQAIAKLSAASAVSFRVFLLDMAVPMSDEEDARPSSHAGPIIHRFLIQNNADPHRIVICTNHISQYDIDACRLVGIDPRTLLLKTEMLVNRERILSLLCE
jgi:ActR/RegA family two-component response regulator